MEKAKGKGLDGKGADEVRASVDAWKYLFGFVNMAVVRCAIELKIADAIENHETPITLAELSLATSCSQPLLYRIMRYLVHHNIFKEQTLQPAEDGPVGYVHTPLSRRLVGFGGESMAAFLLLESSPVMLLPWQNLSARVSSSQDSDFFAPFHAVHDKDIWKYAAENKNHSDLINQAMACDTRLVMPEIVRACADLFEGVGSIVDVGGGNGTALEMIVKAFPWVQGINFDLPHVVGSSLRSQGVENIRGDMFDSVPEADVALLKWVLHDWSDEECIKILRNCREAVPKETGKVIIVEAVVGDEADEKDELEEVRLMLDMVMIAHTTRGKERTLKEWDFVLKQSGLNTYDVRNIGAVQSVIVAYNKW